MPTKNPLLLPSSLPYQLPEFDRIRDEHFAEAFEVALTQAQNEIYAIATNPQPATFRNTVEALEKSGLLLATVSSVFFNLVSAHTNIVLDELHADIAPQLSAYHDAQYLNKNLYQRICVLVAAKEKLDPESQRLLDRYHQDFLRAGAGLSTEKQNQLREINSELSSLSAAFQKNLLAETNDSAVLVTDETELSGLQQSAIDPARTAEGHFLIRLGLPTSQPIVAELTERSLREKIFKASHARGTRGNATDNTEILLAITQLRSKRAHLLGFANHADYVISEETAGSVEAVRSLLERLIPAAVANANAEEKELIDISPEESIEPWDWPFYAEKLRKERYSIDEAVLRPYFELENVLKKGVFFAAQQLYGLNVVERYDLPTYHRDVRAFEVFEENGQAIGLLLLDCYARDTKRGGAWMSSFVRQSTLLGTLPVVVNVLNITKPVGNEPTLLSSDEVVTAFHEFGHGLHGLLSKVRYPSFSGTSVPRDFVEYPSQLNEMWAFHPSCLTHYALHFNTGESLPLELVDRLIESQQYGQGFATTEYLAAAVLDLAWHSLTSADQIADIDTFEREVLTQAGIAIEAIPPRYRSSYFSHIFSGGYSAAYYSYIWAEVLDADSADYFSSKGGLNRFEGERLRETILAKGGSVDPLEAYRSFRGKDASIDALLKRRGLAGV
ncbi:MAG: M3 family metallopeptidase [Mycobacteriaceae bacterium]